MYTRDHWLLAAERALEKAGTALGSRKVLAQGVEKTSVAAGRTSGAAGWASQAAGRASEVTGTEPSWSIESL